MQPNFVTFTGLDAHTDLDRVEALSRHYPIEWGVLFSPARQGVDPRYPALDLVPAMIERIASIPNARLAAHLCGGHAQAIISGESLPDLIDLLSKRFGRFQVNTSDPEADPATIKAFVASLTEAGMGILQCRSARFPEHAAVHWLADGSGGRGVLPDLWPVASPYSPLVGYAGGLGPETISAALDQIRAQHPAEVPFWLDMETGVRTDDRLDLDLCEAVCRAIWGERVTPMSLTYTFPAIVTPKTEHGRAGYLVNFPDLREARTFGWTPEEVEQRGRDCLETALRERIRTGEPIPDSAGRPPGAVMVSVTL